MTTVTIGCKLPAGMFLELGKVNTDSHRAVRLNGANTSKIQLLAGGFGLTEVDAEFWEAWKKKHAWLKALKDELIFAVVDLPSAQAAAVEREKEVSGFEPLDPDKAPKDPSEVGADPDHLKQVRRSGNRHQGMTGRR